MKKLAIGLALAGALAGLLPQAAAANKGKEAEGICRNVVANKGYQG